MNFKIPMLLLIMLISTNCASMFSKKEYQYKITSFPDSDVTLIYPNNRVESLKTPLELKVNMKDDILLRFSAKGYEEKFQSLERSINGWFWVNLILARDVGMAIDYDTGAMYKPKDGIMDIKVELKPLEKGSLNLKK